MTTKEKCCGLVLGIMDYNKGTFDTYRVEIPEGEETDSWVDEFGEAHGHHMSDCYWIIGTELPITLRH